MSGKMTTLKGIVASEGIAIGPCYLLQGGAIPATYRRIEPDEVVVEIERLHYALTMSKEQLRQIKNSLEGGEPNEHALILEFYIMMVSDQMIVADTTRLIRERQLNAEGALDLVMKKIEKRFEGIEDEYLKERYSDVVHVRNRLLRNLAGEKDLMENVPGKVIVVSHDLSPADTIQMDPEKILGFLTDIGGKTSHTSITAKGLKIPAVVGLETVTSKVRGGETIILDGFTGRVSINPSRDLLDRYQGRMLHIASLEKDLEKYRCLPAETRDGFQINLAANIEITSEIQTVIDHGADGIGLYRTEFLYLGRPDLPTEEEHFQAYKEVVEAIHPKAATIRTVDLGGDKFTHTLRLGESINNSMGLRAIRLCLQHVELFKVQLRALLRASHYGNLEIMFPMISCVAELRRAMEILEEVKDELRRRGDPFNPDINIGIMIEVPSAASVADLLAGEVSFFSIGTNDLIQYTLAIERGNEQVAYLYDPLNPSILRILKSVVAAAHKAAIPVRMCGEMAGDPIYVMVLLGLELDQLSMNSVSIPRVKRFIRSVSYRESKVLMKQIINCASPKDIHQRIRRKLAKCVPVELRQELRR